MAYLGNAPARSFISFERQVFTIVNSQTAYTLDHSVNNENDIRLVVNNIVQEPGSGKAYTASGTTLTLSAALTNGTDEMYCVFLGRATATNAPGAGSVNTAAITDLNVTTAKIAADAITEAKIADDAVESEHLNNNVISGQTELASAPASTDELLISDGGTLKRIDFSLIGGSNAPLFFATKGTQQNPSDSTVTKVEYDTEVSDPSGVYDNSSNYRFTPAVAGYYYIFAGVGVTAFGASIMGDAEIYIYKNGSAQVKGRHNASNNYQYWLTPTVQGIIQLDADDYVEIYAKGDVTTSTPIYFYQSSYSWFGGYKLID